MIDRATKLRNRTAKMLNTLFAYTRSIILENYRDFSLRVNSITLNDKDISKYIVSGESAGEIFSRPQLSRLADHFKLRLEGTNLFGKVFDFSIEFTSKFLISPDFRYDGLTMNFNDALTANFNITAETSTVVTPYEARLFFVGSYYLNFSDLHCNKEGTIHRVGFSSFDKAGSVFTYNRG